MSEYRSIRISESLWLKLKQMALDERVTLRAVMERAAGQYIEGLAPHLFRPNLSKSPVAATPKTAENAQGMDGRSEPKKMERPKLSVNRLAALTRTISSTCVSCGHSPAEHSGFGCVDGCGCVGYRS